MTLAFKIQPLFNMLLPVACCCCCSGIALLLPVACCCCCSGIALLLPVVCCCCCPGIALLLPVVCCCCCPGIALLLPNPGAPELLLVSCLLAVPLSRPPSLRGGGGTALGRYRERGDRTSLNLGGLATVKAHSLLEPALYTLRLIISHSTVIQLRLTLFLNLHYIHSN